MDDNHGRGDGGLVQGARSGRLILREFNTQK
jgi:hypothetical protein